MSSYVRQATFNIEYILKEGILMQAKAQAEMTPREIEIIQLLWQELSADEISLKLGISPRTVEAHRWNIRLKIGAKNTVGIIKFALKAGIIKL
jgi:DNA-binding CsgD family transcriptional regulator